MKVLFFVLSLSLSGVFGLACLKDDTKYPDHITLNKRKWFTRLSKQDKTRDLSVFNCPESYEHQVNHIRVWAKCDNCGLFGKKKPGKFNLTTVFTSPTDFGRIISYFHTASSLFIKTKCFNKENIGLPWFSDWTTTSQMQVRIQCMNRKNDCDIYKDIKVDCVLKDARRRLLATTPAIVTTPEHDNTLGNEEDWDAKGCPIYRYVRQKCRDEFGEECSAEKVTLEEAKSLCNEWKENSVCAASVSEDADVEGEYQEDCAHIEDAMGVAFDGVGCNEFLRVNATCHEQHGDECTVEKVSPADFWSVCEEWKDTTNTACIARVADFPDVEEQYRGYCKGSNPFADVPGGKNDLSASLPSCVGPVMVIPLLVLYSLQ